MFDIDEAVAVVPSKRQWQWQQLEYYGFIHFGINTMNDVEWGNGCEDLSVFDPRHLDTDAWVHTLKEAQMTGVILTCKHHDGFCLWPSLTTDFSVASTPWQKGQGDLVKELSNSCKKFGLKFGVYLSPWDQHAPEYGKGAAYDDFYLAQLTELLSNYGEIFCVWLDGANGEGPNGKKQYYDWDRYFKQIRTLQPKAVISVCGPDVRWCGNEAGQTREKEWSVVPAFLQDMEKIAEKSQQVDDGKFSRKITSGDEDLGSREALAHVQSPLIWYPAEVNTSIRPGWFFHEKENAQVRTTAELYDIYLRSVGGNASFLLNVPPDKEGKIQAQDQHSLQGLGKVIRQLQDPAKLKAALLSCSSQVKPITTSDFEAVTGNTWQPESNDDQPWLQLDWEETQEIATLTLQEDILKSQRVEEFTVFYLVNDDWQELAHGHTIGAKKILTFESIQTRAIRVVFEKYRQYPTIAAMNVTNNIE